jgi:hypothetical protein
MPEVIELYGNRQARKCKRGDVKITSEADKVVVRGKSYHKGCEPTADELAAQDRA